MSFGDEQGYGGDANRADDGFGGSGQTRTRLPDGRGGDAYGGGRRPVRGSRSLVTVVGVVVVLIAAIAFANRGGGDDKTPAAGAKGAAADPTAASGVKPVTGTNGTNGAIPAGFAKNEQGAASAAANYAVALGSDGMFTPDSRHAILDAVYTPDAAARLKGALDAAYSTAFLQKLGLDANGEPPQGSTFISRTIPVGTKVESINGDVAKVSVWYTGLIGLSGPGSTTPVTTTWKTDTFDLRWLADDWKVTADAQKNGPAPVPGDVAASTSDAISKAVEQYGGFTYAR